MHIVRFVSIAIVIIAAGLNLQAGAVMAEAPGARPKPVRSKVVGGEAAQLPDWPGIAALGLHSATGATTLYFCGGTVIAPTWVLTAAHCLHEHATGSMRGIVRAADGSEHAAELEVAIGIKDLKDVTAADRFAVSRAILHPVYLKELEAAEAIAEPDARSTALAGIALTSGHDIALLELAKPWQGPIARLSLSAVTDPVDGTRVRVSGFGYTEFSLEAGEPARYGARGGGDIFAGSDLLLQASLGVISSSDCLDHYRPYYGEHAAIGRQQICAGLDEGGRDSCNGDSGGPLVAYGRNGKPYQVGLVSWGKLLCGKGKSYGVYSRISAFADWIKNHVGPLAAFPESMLPNITLGALTPLELDEALGQLRSALAGAAAVGLAIEGPRPIRLGDEFSFVVESAVGGRLMIFDINANLEVTLIFPNRFTASRDLGQVAAGDRLAIPGPDYGFQAFAAQEPAGRGMLLALVVPDEFDLEAAGLPAALQKQLRTKSFAQFDRPAGYFMRFILQIERVASGGSRAADAKRISARDWGLGAMTYEISR